MWVIIVTIITWIIITAAKLWLKTTLGLKMFKPKVLFMEKCFKITLQAHSCWSRRYRKLIRGFERLRRVRLFWCHLGFLKTKNHCLRSKIDSALTTRAEERASPVEATRKTKKTQRLTRTTTKRVPTSLSFPHPLLTPTAARPRYLPRTM